MPKVGKISAARLTAADEWLRETAKHPNFYKIIHIFLVKSQLWKLQKTRDFLKVDVELIDG